MYGTFFQLLNSPNKGALSGGLMTVYYSEVQTGRHCKVQGGNDTARLEAMRSNEISNKIVLFSKSKQRVGHIYSGYFVSRGTSHPMQEDGMSSTSETDECRRFTSRGEVRNGDI